MLHRGFILFAITLFGLVVALLGVGLWYLMGYHPQSATPETNIFPVSIATSSGVTLLLSSSTASTTTSNAGFPSDAEYITNQNVIRVDRKKLTFAAIGCGPACQSPEDSTFQVYPETAIYLASTHEKLTFEELRVGDTVFVTALTDSRGRYLTKDGAIVAKEVSVQIPSIIIGSISPSLATPNASITISGSGFLSLSSLALGGDAYGDGIWLFNGQYSAQLLGSDTLVVSDNTIITNLPAVMCRGQETNACSSSLTAPIVPGIYSIYLRTGEGMTRSNYDTITLSSTSQY